MEVKRSGGTKVTRGAASVVQEPPPAARSNGHERERGEARPRPAAPPPPRIPAVENREPGIPAISGRAATRVVREAAKVLEQELAAGIVAAKRVEERFIDVQQIRSRNPDEVMQRFRRDAHEVVDIVMDVLTVVVDSAANLTDRSFAVSGRRTVTTPAPGERPQQLSPRVPTLSTPEPVPPGKTVEIMISVENDSDKPTLPIVFRCSDLLSSEGASIPGGNVQCTPNEIILAPRTVARVAVRIHVPEGAAPGAYCGMFQANNLEAVRAVLMVEVRGTE